MRKRILSVFYILFCQCTLLIGQNKAFNFSGTLVLPDNSQIPYHLVFNENNGIINGYSISDSFGINETKSSISGSFQNNLFTLSESDVMYTKSNAASEDFCFLTLYLKQKNRKKINMLTGTFKGYYSDTSLCVTGSVHLIDSLSFIKQKEKFLSKQSLDKPLNDSLSVKTLTEDSSLSFSTSKKEISLIIWDSGKIDDDRITIHHNEDCILSNYSIKKEKMLLKVHLKKGKNIIKIKAINNGYYAPNTSRIQIVGDKKTYDTVTSLDKDKEARIIIKKKPL